MSSKRKQSEKTDRHPPKKPKIVPEPDVGLKAKGKKKTVTKPYPRKGKRLMTGYDPSIEKAPILLHEDSKYVLEQLSSIITVDDYEDLSNHATEAMGETGLFCIAQVISQPSTFIFSFLTTFLLLTHSSSGNANNEGVDGPLPRP